jgi:hypothetical protein
MADGLPLPTAPGAPFRASPARIRAVETARAAFDAGTLGNPRSRAVLILGGLFATFAVLVGMRRRRGVAETALFSTAIGGFLVVGPGLSMSSVRTQDWYLTQGLLTLFVFAALAWTVLRRWASPHVVAAVCLIFPVLALVAMRGSLGRSDVSPLESVLWPSLGLVPASVCAAIALVEGWLLLRARSRGSAPREN